MIGNMYIVFFPHQYNIYNKTLCLSHVTAVTIQHGNLKHAVYMIY